MQGDVFGRYLVETELAQPGPFLSHGDTSDGQQQPTQRQQVPAEAHYTDPYELLAIALAVSMLLSKHLDNRQIATLINLFNLIVTNLESWLAQNKINNIEDITPLITLTT